MTDIIGVIICIFLLTCLFLLGYCVGCMEENDLAIIDLNELLECANEWPNLTAEKHAEIERRYDKERKEYNNKHILRRVFKL